MESDLVLMTDNAKRYNEPKSIIYKDACKLRRLARSVCKELESLMQQGKLMQSSKTREKKLKLLNEVGESGDDSPMDNLNHNDEDNDAEVDEQQQQQQQQEEDEEEEDESDDEETTKKTKASDETLMEVDDESGDEETTVVGKSRKRAPSQLVTSAWILFDFVKEFKHGNQTIIDPFLKLPSKRTYPDYYEDIKNPIAMNIIKKKLNKRKYESLGELVADFELMFNNALEYNLEDSLVYKNAKRILDALRPKSAELAAAMTSHQSPATPVKTTPKRKYHRSTLAEIKIKKIFNALMDYEEETGVKNARKRVLSAQFLNLPSNEQYPDYYEKIKEPIDLNMVKKRLESGLYQAEVDLFNDCMKILNNAKLYYGEATQIHKDAVKLLTILASKYREETAVPSANNEATLPKFGALKEKQIYLYNYINDFQVSLC